MAEDPRYLRNESRAAHRAYRRNQRMLRWMALLWLILVGGITSAAAADAILNLGWGYETKDIRGGLLMIFGGCVIFAFVAAVNRLVLAMSRRIFGPEPHGPTES